MRARLPAAPFFFCPESEGTTSWIRVVCESGLTSLGTRIAGVFAPIQLRLLFVTIPARGGHMDILAQLKAARDKAAFELGRLEAAVSALSGIGSNSIRTRRRKMSASARRRISLAQKARWAKRNLTGRAGARPKRHVSAASRRKMALAQRARWAKVRKSKA